MLRSQQRHSVSKNSESFPRQRAGFSGNLQRIDGNPSSCRLFYPAVFRNSSTRSGTSIREIATPACALVRNDWEIGFAMTRMREPVSSNREIATPACAPVRNDREVGFAMTCFSPFLVRGEVGAIQLLPLDYFLIHVSSLCLVFSEAYSTFCGACRYQRQGPEAR